MTELEVAIRICRRLQDAGYLAYIVGGAIRDKHLDRIPHDYDISTSATPTQVSEIFGEAIRPDVGRQSQCKVSLVVLEGIAIHVATFRSDGKYSDSRHPDEVILVSSPQEDQQRRDFTVNALMWDPIADKILDFVGGLTDLAAKIIRFIGDPVARICEDAIRILRAIRFEAVLGFEIEPASLEACTRYADRLELIPIERITAEFMKGLASENPVRFMERLRSTGMLKYIIPELLDMINCPQNPAHHPEGDVWVHTMLTVKNVSNSPLQRLAALLHDVGKPSTRDVHNRCFGHDDVGADMSREIMTRLKFSNEDIDYVEYLVRKHMSVFAIFDMRKAKVLAFAESPMFSNLLDLLQADILASLRNPSGSIADITSHVTRIRAEFGSNRVPKSLLNGDEIMEILKVGQGPHLQEIKTALIDAQCEGLIKTRTDAVEFLKR
ncbi:MAG TPA: CCA tRNA nucleotidyltransferase [Bacteroidales bacterium]|nr:CCA tRNA nucleotidyltransferase [Bacteroidales bacterium]